MDIDSSDQTEDDDINDHMQYNIDILLLLSNVLMFNLLLELEWSKNVLPMNQWQIVLPFSVQLLPKILLPCCGKISKPNIWAAK